VGAVAAVAEWTGGLFDPTGQHFYVSIQHNATAKASSWTSPAGAGYPVTCIRRQCLLGQNDVKLMVEFHREPEHQE